MNIKDIEIIKAIEALKNGGIISTPSESSYGLSCLYTSKEGIKKIFSLKQRQANKGLILVGHSWSLFDDLIDLEGILQKNIDIMFQSWPGANTWVLPLKKSSALNIFPTTGNSIAIRITKHPVLSQLSKYFNLPLVSTSANVSNNPPATTISEVKKYFQDQLDFIIEAEKPCCGKPTPIYDIITLNQVR